MALSQAAAYVEKLIGHNDNAETAQDITNPARDRAKYGHPTETMQALTWEGKNTVKVSTVPRPVVVEPRDVILEVTGSTVCGSDLHLLHGSVIQMEKGDILGHEFCGRVKEKGDAVTNLNIGDRVVASFQIGCGDCMYCKKKLSSQCNKTNANKTEYAMYGGNTAGMFGYSHFTGGFAGGQAEYVRVPNGDVNLLKIPKDVPDEKALYLSDVLATSYHCVVDTGVKEGDVVAIWGAGPIGQMCADYAFLEGASRVIMIDSVQWRLEFIKSKLPKIEYINFAELASGETVVSKLKEMVKEGPDVALECAAGEYAKSIANKLEMAAGLQTDTAELINEMIMSVKSFGRCGVTGVYVGYANHFNVGALMERGVRLIGNGQAPVWLYWEKLLKMIQDGTIEPLKMVTHRVDISEIDKVYYKFDKKEDNIQKVFISTKFSDPPAPGAPQLTTY